MRFQQQGLEPGAGEEEAGRHPGWTAAADDQVWLLARQKPRVIRRMMTP